MSINKNTNSSILGYDQNIGPRQTVPMEIQNDPYIISQVNNPGNIYNSQQVSNRLINYTTGKNVSLSAFMFLLSEIIIYTVQGVPSSSPGSLVEEKLKTLGYSIGIRLLELLQYRSSLPQPTRSFFGGSSSGTSNNNTNNTDNSTVNNISTLSGNITNNTNISGDLRKSSNVSGNISVSTASNATASIPYSINGNFISLLENTTAQNIQAMEKRSIKIIEILQFLHGPVWRYCFGKNSDDLVKSSERENEYMIIDNDPLISQLIAPQHCNYFICGIIQGVLDHACFPTKTITAHIMPDKENRFDNKTIYLIIFERQVIEREKV
ncbi:TRAPP subunit TRS31 SCDLUD_004899 [Saccharomycodes ludwigii]|uniref:TRAPP subunit TRS31 n=1 Tax=Saccharomycodes ludwigii TaxID=36035 RepID=UPI001E85580A|nr:hypothetical protein SCDLUD_004899 [Saccharomycodes ludwigii]KAH3899456.1 hypothetical protein SCDLUD_004899 [Saccharomycodes ludwigii]